MVLLQAGKLLDRETVSQPEESTIFSCARSRRSQYQKHFLTLVDSIHTLYLFTSADILTFLVPTLLFALFGALSGNLLHIGTAPSLLAILTRIPSIFFLVWSNLLVFDVANQRLPDAILEDSLNKPSRPLPSGRITASQSRRLLLIAVPSVLALSWYLGPWQETLLLFSINWMYNDLKGCDEDFILRNLLIAIGYGLYNSAALRIACGIDSTITSVGIWWIVLVSCVIFTTEHICDLKDQMGDKARGRRTAPLVMGDGVARWTIAVPVLVWSLACPYFFGLGCWGYLVPVSSGLVVALRTLLLRSLDEDRLTWKMWALWTIMLFSLPLVKEHSIVTNSLGAIVKKLCIGPACSDSLNLVGVSSIAMVVESRRLRGYVFGTELETNSTLVKR